MSRSYWVAALAACTLGMCGLGSAAGVGARIDDPALAARIDGAPLYALGIECMTRLARDQTPNASRAAVLQTAIANRLLAAAARSDFKEEELRGANRVGFMPDVASDDQLAATLRAQFAAEIEAALRALPGGTLNGLISRQNDVDPAMWETVFGKPGKLQLDYALNAEQQALAKRIVLLHYRLGAGKNGTISLYDVYHRQNVQGRVELFDRNLNFLQDQARLKLAGLYIVQWAVQKFGQAAVDDLRQVLADQDEVRALMELHGIGNDLHSNSALLDRLAKRVGTPEIGRYYRAHQDEFKRIVRVKARHIRVADEAIGKEVSAAAARGESFSALAQRYSNADDAKAGGDLGWIAHEGKLGWLAQLAFIQPEREVSRPFRTPADPDQAAPWEIVLVEQRVQGYQAVDSEAVRYAARNAIAREQAAAQLKSLRERLLRNARIEINDKLLDEPVRPALKS